MSTDILISFDTTGSMSPCIAEVRRRVTETTYYLFNKIEDLRIGIISHGDYCDGPKRINLMNFTDDRDEIAQFIREAPNTDGGDSDECYELVLHHAELFDWQADNRIMILIGDAEPHRVGYRWRDEVVRFDWREMARELASKRVHIYSVQALDRRASTYFYEELAHMTNGRKINLNQFVDAVETIVAISYHGSDNHVELDSFKNELQGNFKMNRNLAAVFEKLGTGFVEVAEDHSGLIPVSPSRFQILHVDYPTDIKSFVQNQGVRFAKGRGFYQFTKSEIVQETKEVILRNKYNGDMFTGAEARNFIGLPFGSRGTIRPGYFDQYEVYIQSTSVNRKLLPNTKFLYENS